MCQYQDSSLLELRRPLIFLDVETTGTSLEIDRIIQIGLIKVYPDKDPREWSTYINPGIPIPPEVTADIHHITDEMVKDAPSFCDIAGQLYTGFKDCDFSGYNVTFDIKFLVTEFRRCNRPLEAGVLDGCIVDSYKIFSEKFPRTLEAAYKKYTGDDIQEAHDALADAKSARRLLEAQLEYHPDLPRTVEELHKFCQGTKTDKMIDSEGKLFWRNGEACLKFGKYAGKPLREQPKNYLQWILKNDFTPEFKGYIQNALNGIYPVRATASAEAD